MAQLAVEYRLPIIDLSRTFDPNKKSHYGSTPIEPSNISGQFIADLIAQVLHGEIHCCSTVQGLSVVCQWILLCW